MRLISRRKNLYFNDLAALFFLRKKWFFVYLNSEEPFKCPGQGPRTRGGVWSFLHNKVLRESWALWKRKEVQLWGWGCGGEDIWGGVLGKKTNPAWKSWSLRLKQCLWDPPLKMTVKGFLAQRYWIILFQSFARQRWNPLTSTLPLPPLPRLTVKPVVDMVSGLVFRYIQGVRGWRKREWSHAGVNVGQVRVGVVSHRVKIKNSE